MRVKASAWLLSVCLVIAGLWANQHSKSIQASREKLIQKMALAHTIKGLKAIDCAALSTQNPLVILALGQSNAGNHGEPASGNNTPVPMVADGQCVLAADPLPGGTGDGGSIWHALPQELQALGLNRPVVLSVIGIDATTLADWTRRNSPLRQRLVARVQTMSRLGLAPSAILWQQGEADAREGTSTTAYAAGLDALANTLQSAGAFAPVFLALSTVCRSTPHKGIRAALASKPMVDARFKPGPDTDMLAGKAMRHDGCHFSAQGQARAARIWAEYLAAP
jgi:lysophospholipase L1-like esterase